MSGVGILAIQFYCQNKTTDRYLRLSWSYSWVGRVSMVVLGITQDKRGPVEIVSTRDYRTKGICRLFKSSRFCRGTKRKDMEVLSSHSAVFLLIH